MREQDNLQQQYASQREDSAGISIRQLANLFLSRWYFFVISVVVLLAIGYFYLKTRPQIYESKASILIRIDHSAPEELFLLKGLGSNFTGRSNRDNEIGSVKSLDLVCNVISSLELNTSYRLQTRMGFYSSELYKQSPLYVKMEGVEPEFIPGTIELIFIPVHIGFSVDATYFSHGQKRKEKVAIEALPAIVELEVGNFYVSKGSTHFGTEPLKVSISNALTVARSYINNLEVDNSERRSSLLYMVLKTKNREMGQDFIAALISEYNLGAAIDKNIISYNKSLFIEERIKDVAIELGQVDEQVESFRRTHKVADIETQVGSYLNRGEIFTNHRLEI